MTHAIFSHPDNQPFVLGDGPIGVLLLHGFMGSPRELRPLAQALAEHGVTARAIQLPGFGPDMDRMRQVRAREWLTAADAAWAEISAAFSRTALIGFSMGGALAIQLAATARRPPDRLVLLAPHWRFADRRAVALPVAKRVVKELRPFGDFDQQWVRQFFTEMDPTLDLDDPAVQARLRRETVLPLSTLDELRRVSVAAGRLAPRVTMPALVLQGRRDDTSLPHHTRRLAMRLGGPLTFHELDAGHMLVADTIPAWPAVRDLALCFVAGNGLPERLQRAEALIGR